MNAYLSTAALMRALNLSAFTAAEAAFALDAVDAASRIVDGYTHRHFYTEAGIRYLDTRADWWIPIHDTLSLSAFEMDTDGDGLFDDEVWAADADYWLMTTKDSFHGWPKCVARQNPQGAFSFGGYARGLRLTGVFGHGDGERASPWDALGSTVTAADASTTAITTSGTLEPGWTIRVGAEDMFVESFTAGTPNAATVKRGVNGSTAAGHTTIAASVAKYPSPIVKVVRELASESFNNRENPELLQLRVGEYFEARSFSGSRSVENKDFLNRALAPYVRGDWEP